MSKDVYWRLLSLRLFADGSAFIVSINPVKDSVRYVTGRKITCTEIKQFAQCLPAAELWAPGALEVLLSTLTLALNKHLFPIPVVRRKKLILVVAFIYKIWKRQLKRVHL